MSRRRPNRCRRMTGFGATASHQAVNSAGSSRLAPSVRIVSATGVAWGKAAPARLPASRCSARASARASVIAASLAASSSSGGSAQARGAPVAESLWQGAIRGAGRGQRRARGEAVLAQRKVERVGPGMGMGEKAGGLEIGEAGDQPFSDARGGHFGAGVEPGEQIGRRAEREQQRAPSVGRGAPQAQGRLPFHNVGWHGLVLLGAGLHWAAVANQVMNWRGP